MQFKQTNSILRIISVSGDGGMVDEKYFIIGVMLHKMSLLSLDWD